MDYEEVRIQISNKVKVIGDGYDEVFIKKGATIKDGNRMITEKAVSFAHKTAFWKAFMKRNDFIIIDETIEMGTAQTKIDQVLNKTQEIKTLQFNKNQ